MSPFWENLRTDPILYDPSGRGQGSNKNLNKEIAF